VKSGSKLRAFSVIAKTPKRRTQKKWKKKVLEFPGLAEKKGCGANFGNHTQPENQKLNDKTEGEKSRRRKRWGNLQFVGGKSP